MDRMILALQPSDDQQNALETLAAEQQDSGSSQFHRFLTPEQFAASFGVSSNDLAKISAWLTASGFYVDEVAANHMAVVFSGTASQVDAAFHTQMRRYVVNGEIHYANATAPQIPSAISAVVQGFVKLNDFHASPALLKLNAKPQFTSAAGTHALAPADFATIYDLNPLYAAGISGTAQSIAVIGRSNINLSDVAAFRADYGLPASNVTAVFATGTDPGVTGDDSTLETTLDVEWAGAVAPAANVKYVIAASTASTDGIDLAMQYAVNHSVAPILSVSYGACEAVANNAFYNGLWKQAAVQGITVLVAAGDSGAAGCDGSSSAFGSAKAVNGICSTPYDTCVGGTMFNDTANPGQYWLPGNNAVMGSAVGYIPEIAWNESALNGGSGLLAGGGGVSSLYLKPYWQYISGDPADGHRDVPDIALTAAQHDGYMIYYAGAPTQVAGTSVATASFAGIMALVSQKVGSSQGNINQTLYPLSTGSSHSAVFHDVVSGNTSVPGVTGYNATVGFDLATGLGSVDGAALANSWANIAGGFSLTASAATVNVAPGVNGKIIFSLTDFAAFDSPVTLTLSALPSGIFANFVPGTLTGSGTSVLTIAAAGTAVSGTYPITVTAKGGNFTRTVGFNLVVVVNLGCTLSASPASLTMFQGQSASSKLVCSNPQGTFSTGLALSVTGAPAGLNTSFSPAASLVAGAGVSTLTLTAAGNVTPGAYTLQVTATLPGASPAFSSTFSLPVTVNAPSTFSVTPSVTLVSMLQGATGTVTLTSLHSGSFNSAIAFSTSGLPSSVSASLSASTVAAPGDGSITLTLQALSITTPGTYAMTVLAQGGGISLRIPIAVQITMAPAFTLSASSAVMTLRQAFSSTLVFSTGSLTNGFNSAVTFSVGALPAGVSAVFSSATIAAPGSGVTTLALTGTATATTGISTFTVTATGGTISRALNIQLTVTGSPAFSLSTSFLTSNLMAGGSMTETVTSTPLYGYNSNIQLTATGQAGITGTFSPAVISGAYGTSRLTLQAVSTMAPGTYPVSVMGTDPVTGNTSSIQINLVIGTVSTSINTPVITLAPGNSATATLTTVTTAYTGDVALSVTGLPGAVSYSLSTTSLPTGSGTSTLTLRASSFAVAGTYQVVIQSSAVGVVFTTTFALTIT